MGNFLTVSQTSQTPVNSSLRGRWGEIDGLRICARPTLVICSVHESQHGTRGCDGPREGGGGGEERRGEARRGVPAAEHPRQPPLPPWVGSEFGSGCSTSDVRRSGSQ